MEISDELLALPIFRNSLVDWLIALGIGAGLFLTLLAARRLIRRQHQRVAKTPETEIIELPLQVLSCTSAPFLLVLSAFAGLGALQMGELTAQVLRSAATWRSSGRPGRGRRQPLPRCSSAGGDAHSSPTARWSARLASSGSSFAC